MLRLCFLLPYLKTIRDVRIVIDTTHRLATPFVSIIFAYYLITFEYQVIGEWMFSGLVLYSNGYEEAVEAGGDGINILYNFNDFCGSFMVLNAMLVTNNWNDFVDLFAEVSGMQWEVRVYFSVFFYLAALIIVNIITSFVVEIYDQLSDEIDLDMQK